MYTFSQFTFQLLCLLLLLLLIPMIANSDDSLYFEGLTIANGEVGTDILSMQTFEYRYGSTNPLWKSNLNYFWRVGSSLNLSIIYSSIDKSLTTFFEFSSGVGLSYPLLKGARGSVTPYVGLFLSDELDFTNRLDIFSTEFGIEINLWSRVSLIGSYIRSFDLDADLNAFRFGISLH